MTTNDLNPPPDTSATTAFAEGQKLAGCYALLRRITSSPGPEVWLADDEVLGKNVTLHILPGTVVQDARALQDLRSEIKRIRQLIHPQILRVYDLIEEPEWAAVSMNAFEGESVASRCNAQPHKRFPVAELEPWVFKLIQTVDDAHRINFLHRDLAPENIYLTPAGQPLVANFGISRTIQDALARAGKAEATRVAYVSPQVLDETAPARTDDVYSLGAVLYTLLVGAPPFADAAQVRAGVSAEKLSALGQPDLQVPVTWQKAIAAALQKSPEHRPQSAAEFLKILKGEMPAPALPTPVVETAPAPAVLPAAAPIAEAVTAAKAEATPKAAAELRLESQPEVEPVGEPVTARPSEPVPGPEPEMDEKKALEELSKFDRPQTPAKPPQESPKPWLQRPEPKGAGGAGAGAGDAAAPPSPGPKKPSERLLTEFKPRLYPEESRFPVVAIGAAAVILVILVIYFLSTSGKKGVTREAGQTTPVAAPATPKPTQEKIHNLTTTPVPPVVVVNTPPPATAPSSVGSLAQEKLQKDIADMQSTLDKAKQASGGAEKVHADRAKEQQTADAAVAESQKAFDEMTKANLPLKAVVDDLTAQRKKLEESQKAAEAAAEDAQKVAAEKARVVEEGKKALADLQKEGDEKMAAQGKAAAELDALQKTLTEKQKVAADASKAAADADGIRQQQLATVTKLERDLASAKATLEMRGSLTRKIENLKNSQETVARPLATPASTPSINLSSPPPPATPSPMAKLTTPAPMLTTPVPVPATPAPAAKPTPAPATPAPTIPAVVPSSTPAAATNAASNAGANSLGMKFAPIGDIDFCIWLVRVKDFEIFAKAVSLKSTAWESPGFRQGPDHPVVNVTWVEAVAFCKWLTDKEHKEGVLPANQIYRLPSDMEWSKAVGLPAETGKTPEARDMDVPDVYPWGTDWPPPKGAGNYTGEETGSDVAIKGYDDGYAWTSPVGSFSANKYGLYDMGGNVWEWCDDSWNNESKAKVLRGASWYNGALKLSLLSSCRVHAAPDSSTDNYGFRVVRASEGAAAVKGRFR
ncbi:MAG TPA: SUMF1/EgtB/PvdO family nonheme iron enzyme [Chthoniobacter sp.]